MKNSNHKNRLVTAIMMSSLLVGAASAAVSVDEAKPLGNALTPWGAEKNGNKEGTIPAYGKDHMVKAPEKYDPKKPGLRPDPYASEKPRLTITAANMAQYSDKLTEGQKELLKKYPTFRMDVYPTHRTMRYPDYINENSIRNATSCKATSGGLDIEGCYGGVLFPIPKTGYEVMWNHNMKYSAPSFFTSAQQVQVDTSGNNNIQGVNDINEEYTAFYQENRNITISDKAPFYMVRLDTTGPARKVGEKLSVIEYTDSHASGRKVYQYLPGQRRVKLAPDLAYDTPNPQSGGAALMDEVLIFTGPLDRFDFKLVGKKEIFIPYNNFRMNDANLCRDVRFMKGHVNPDCYRWELHRTWVVEATLKPGIRHAYSKRVFYFDEDTAGAGIAEGYDASGKLYRSVFGDYKPWYETSDQGESQNYLAYDFTTGAYLVAGDTIGLGGYYPAKRKLLRFFSSEALAGEGIR